MTQYIDKYGRTWNYQPAHNPDRMLKIRPEIMLAAYNFQAVIRNQSADVNVAHREGWPVEDPDCYLLAFTDRNGKRGWYAGIRLSDDPCDYISPHFDDRVIDFMIEHHGLRCGYVEYQVMMDFGLV